MKKLFKETKYDWRVVSEKVWQDGIIVFDTNVLLNLYRYNKEARNELIKLMKSYQNRLWMPYQVGLEFMANCETVKAWIHKGFTELVGQVDKCKNDFFKFYDDNYAKHKHIHRKELEKLFDQQLQPIKDKLKEWEKALPDYEKKDVVKNRIMDLYDNRVGDDYNYDELLEIYAKGKIRYDNKIPPGYRDNTKDKWEMGARHVFGDLISWMQIMDHAKANDKDVIFVGEDLKEDWWEKEGGKLDKPRHELLEEFRYRTGREIVFHTQKGFIDASKKKLKEETLKEVERVREENMRMIEKLKSVSEAISSSIPQFDYSALEKVNYPSFDVIKTLATTPNIQAIQESWKNIKADAKLYEAMAERMSKMNESWISSLLPYKKSEE